MYWSQSGTLNFLSPSAVMSAAQLFYGSQVESLADVCSKKKLYLYIQYVGIRTSLYTHTH